jgi:hypothetical protein
MRQLIDLAVLGTLAALLGFAGCSAPQARVHTYSTRSVIVDPPARVVVVPFAVGGPHREAGPIVTQAVALAMQGALSNDVFTASLKDERIAAESALWQRGRIDMSTLVAAQKDYLADAFLFGAVTEYRPYDPPLIGLKLRMISARTGGVLWAAEAAFDARDSEIRDLGVAYFKDSGLRDKLYGPDLLFVSPKQYATFVAQEMLQPLKGLRTRHLQGELITQ